MKVTVYKCREFDERPLFLEFAKELGLELVLCEQAPTMENLELAEGSTCVNIITSETTRELLEEMKRQGVRYLTTRTIGYDHIDMTAAKELGITVANAPYGPNGVADYAVMMILASLRKLKRILERTNIQDYTLQGIQGRELKNLTVGIVGTGRIGETVIQNLSGFGCRILAYDLFEKEAVRDKAAYVSLEELLKQSDVISLHAPLTEENHHMIKEETIAMMKDGVVLVNTARGGLISSEALIRGIETGKIGAAGLDVVEHEFGLYYNDRKWVPLDNRELAVLRGFPNVTITHHMAFYTEEAVRTMVRDSLMGCKLFLEGSKNPWEVS